LAKLSRTGQLIYKAEKGACRAIPHPPRDELAREPKRTFQALDPLDFLAKFTQRQREATTPVTVASWDGLSIRGTGVGKKQLK
jgi:hypothetical protein